MVEKMYMFYGPAGSGKSTQGQLLARKLGGVWLSAGQISRERFAEYTRTAAMVPEADLAMAILAEIERAETAGHLVVFDGQPWSVEGAGILWRTGVLARAQKLLILTVPRSELLRRLAARGRADDRAENWQRKLAMYDARMPAFLRVLRRYHVPIVEIDGVGTPTEVAQRVNQAIAR